VCGSSVSSAWVRVICSPLLTVVFPGLNLRFEKIFELIWTSSVPMVRMVLPVAPLALVPIDSVTAASAATAASRPSRDPVSARIAEPMDPPPGCHMVEGHPAARPRPHARPDPSSDE
jgi:hypothetical protein